MQDNIKKFDSKKYKEVIIDKLVIDGKEKKGGFISADDTKGKQELNVTVYTQKNKTVPQIMKGRSKIHELFKKVFFHRKRN